MRGRLYAWQNEALLTPLQEEWAGRLWKEGSCVPAWNPLATVAYSLECTGWIVRKDEEQCEELVKQRLRTGWGSEIHAVRDQ